ncbi:MAG: hypothetical protein R3B13_00285 [Polyangiaceae bacterium]
MERRGLLGAGICAIVFAATSSAFANDYQVPSGCPSRAEFERKLDERVQSAPSRAYRTQVNVEVKDDELTGSVRISSGSELTVRTLSASSCSELIDALALSAALAIDELEEAAAAPPKPSPAAPPEPAPTAPPEPSFTSRLEFGAGLALPYRTATSESGSLGVGALFTVAVRGTGLAPSGALHLERHGGRAQGTTGSADLTWFGAALDLCPVRFGDPWFVAPCMTAELASLTAEARGVKFPRDPARLVFASGAGGRGGLRPLPWLELAAEAFVLGSISRPSFTFDNGETVFEVPAVAGRLGFAVVAFLP